MMTSSKRRGPTVSRLSNNYEDLTLRRGDEGRFRGEKISRKSEDVYESRRRRKTPRRDGMEMVGDWKPRGEESLPRREASRVATPQ